MNKKIVFAVIILLGVLGVAVGVYFSKINVTAEGALNQLQAREDGDVIPLTDNRKALIIEENGQVSIASSRSIPPFRWYEDFKVHPTSLNIDDINEPGQIPYVESPVEDSIHVGLIKNKEVEYTISGLKNQLDFRQNSIQVFNLEDYQKNAEALKDVKLWWTTYPLDEISQNDHFFFLDKNKKILTINKADMKGK